MDVSPRTSPPALAEVVAPTNRRQLMTTAAIVAVLILTVDLVAAALLAWRPVARDHWLVASKWRLLDRARATDTLVLGDSSCNQGVRPDVLGAALGGSVLNLCTIGDLLVINDAWMLEAYLRRHPPPARVVVANRTVAKADELVARHAALAQAHGVRLAASALQDVPGRFDVVVNATASSLSGADVPVPAGVLKPGALACDMMYGPAADGFLQWAARHGAVGRDGLGMLVEQAAEAFLLWRGVRPPSAQVLAELRAELAR